MVLTLTLTNIRCWEGTHKFKFTTDFVLLSGPSGKGKTSILESILYALYGKVSKICTEGKTKCRVILSLQTPHVKIKIDRSKGPNKLLVDNKHEGNDGQKVIDGIFGNQTKFLLSSYIKQKSQNSFLGLSPTEKLEFIESIAMSESTSSTLKARVKDAIKKIQTELACKQSELKSLNEIRETSSPSPGKKVGKTCTTELLRNHKVIVDEKTNIESSLHSSLSVANSKLLEEMKIKTKLDEYTKRISDYNKELSELDYHQVDIDKYNSQLELLQSIEKYADSIENTKKIKELRESLSSEIESLRADTEKSLQAEKKSIEDNSICETVDLNELYSHVRDIVEIEALGGGKPVCVAVELDNYNNELETINDSISVLKRNIEIVSNVLTCPKCNCSLTLKEDSLVESDSGCGDVDTLKKQLKTNKKRRTTLIEKVETTNGLMDRYKKYTKLTEKVSGSITDFNGSYKNLKKELKNRIKIQKEKTRDISVSMDKIDRYEQKLKLIENEQWSSIPELRSIHHQICEIEVKIDQNIAHIDKDVLERYTSIKKEVSSMEKSITHNKFVSDRERRLQEKMAKLEKYILTNGSVSESVECTIRDINREKEELSQIRSSISKLRRDIDDFQTYLEWKRLDDAHTQVNEKIRGGEEEEKVIVKKLNVHQTLKELISKAESISISSIVNTINIHVKDYLDNFFSDDPISVEIKTFKEVKKNKKPQINVEVGYRSMKCDPSSLSGGEYDRVQMAFTLAISDLVHSPLILLDESVSSLDEKTSSSILETIKNGIQNKSVINVAHQVCSGSFTEIVKL